MEVDEPMMKEWVVRSLKEGQQYSPVPTSIAMSTFSKTGGSGTMSTNKMLKQLNNIPKTKPNAPMAKELDDANFRSQERFTSPT